MNHQTSVELMKFLSGVAVRLGIGKHVYVVGGAVRNFMMDPTGKKYPVKDIDVVVDSIGAGKDSAWFASKLVQAIPAVTKMVTNQYGVAIIHIQGDWFIGKENLKGEDIEIANARKESYGDSAGKGYKPHMVEPATIEDDVIRREFSFNTLMWRLYDLASGPDKAEILDLTGCGKKDLAEGFMRCPSSPDKTFSDDPSRMIRAIKFLLKYGFKIDPEVEASIRRNAKKLKNIPSSHLSNMLLNVFFSPGYGSKALLEMDKLGLLDVIREITVEDKTFRETLANWATKSAKLDFFFELMDYDMPTGRRLKFLSPEQLIKLRTLTAPMDEARVERFLDVLEQPGKIIHMKEMIEDFGLSGVSIKKLITEARDVLMNDPKLVTDPEAIEEIIRLRMGKKKTAKVYSEADMSKALNEYENALDILIEDYESYNKQYPGVDVPSHRVMRLKSRMNNPWVRLINTGTKLTRIILDQKSIPTGQAKKMETVARLFLSARQFPRDFDKWFGKNADHIIYLKKAAMTWKDKAEGDELFQSGPFEVHNTIGATDKELEGIKDLVQRGTALVKKVGGPLSGYTKTLYGDIFVVGRLQQTKTVAWYQFKDDSIYLRILKSSSWDDLQSLLHELAHRFWDKFVPNDVKARWLKHHRDIRWSATGKVPMPEVGDRLPFAINKTKEPKILEINGMGYVLDIPSKRNPEIHLTIDRAKMYKWIRETYEVSKYPTRYAATNPEEHFCEAMALYALGRLGPEHVEALMEAFTGVDPSSVVKDVPEQRIASRFIKKVAKTFTIDPGEPIVYGKYQNKRGTVVGFKTNEKGDVVVIIEPYPKGMKKNQEVRLFKIRPDSIPRDTDVEKMAVARIASKYQNKKEVPKAEGKGTTTVYEYSDRQIQNRNRDKAERVEKLRGKLDKLRQAVTRDLKSKDLKTRMTALAIGLINDTYERVGNEGSAEDGHFGVTGWLVKHVSLGKGKATIKYVGKSGVSHTKEVTSSELIRGLKEAMEDKGKDAPLFKGDGFTVSASTVNEYLKPFDITAKDIRGLHANREVQQALKSIRSKGGKLPDDPKEKEAKLKKEFAEAIEIAAKAVGHEPSTLKNQYLVPGVEENYLKDGTVKENLARQKKASEDGFRTPMPKTATKTHAEKEDDEAERMVKPLPKKNPPRDDLRNRTMDTKEDDDVKGTRADEDPDMSLNYKRVASIALRWLMSKEKRSPGDIWQTDKGWSVKLEEGNIQQADDRAEAQAILDRFRSKGGAPEDDIQNDSSIERDEDGEMIGVDPDSPVFEAVAKKFPKDQIIMTLYMRELANGSEVDLPTSVTRSKAFKQLDMPIGNPNVSRNLLKADGPYADILKLWDKMRKKHDPKPEPEKQPEPEPEQEPAQEEPAQEEPAQEEPASDETEPGSETPSGEDNPEEPEDTEPPPAQEDTGNQESLMSYQALLADLKKEGKSSVVKEITQLDETEQMEVIKAYQNQMSQIQAELDKGPLSDQTISDASEALEEPTGGGMANPEMMGQSLALYAVARNLIANPAYMGGNSTLREIEPSMHELADKASDAADYYSGLTMALRQEAVRQAMKIFKSLPADSPKRVELDSVVDGLHHASIIRGDFDDPKGRQVSIRPPPGPGLMSIMKVMAENGDDKELLRLAIADPMGLASPEAKNKIREILNDMEDEDLYEACGGEDGPDKLTIEVLQGEELSTKDREYIKDMLISGLVDSISAQSEIADLLVKTQQYRDIHRKNQPDGSVAPQVEEKTEPSDSSTPQSQSESELMGGHEDTEIRWGYVPKGGEASPMEIQRNIEDEVRTSQDKYRVELARCRSKRKSKRERKKCLTRLERRMAIPPRKNPNQTDESSDMEIWKNIQNDARLEGAKQYLTTIEHKLGALPDDDVYKAQVLNAIQENDAHELDLRYIKEGDVEKKS